MLHATARSLTQDWWRCVGLIIPLRREMKQSNWLKTNIDLTELMVVFATLAFLLQIGWSLPAVCGLLIIFLALVSLISREQS